MIPVQVAEADRIDVVQPGMPLQHAKCPVSEVKEHPEAVSLD